MHREQNWSIGAYDVQIAAGSADPAGSKASKDPLKQTKLSIDHNSEPPSQ